ncbi:prepilin peptidase, partial [Escherichia coli]|nr:prepilin peptidase [Escherichia coli]
MDATLPFLILYACLSVLLFLWDAKHGLLPDRFTCPLLWSGLLFSQVCNPDG